MLNTRERRGEDRTGDNDEHQVQIYSFSPCLPTQLLPPPPPTYKGAWARTFLSDARQPKCIFLHSLAVALLAFSSKSFLKSKGS